jgi:hypothetical protein
MYLMGLAWRLVWRVLRWCSGILAANPWWRVWTSDRNNTDSVTTHPQNRIVSVRHFASYVWGIQLARWYRLVGGGRALVLDLIDVVIDIFIGGVLLENDDISCGSGESVSVVSVVQRARWMYIQL